MSHLSEGELNGWLDGALVGSDEEASIRSHLEACAECAERLEEAREIRDAATAILREAAPAGTAPPFDEIATRAAAGAQPVGGMERKARSRTHWISPERLGWAATVVLALGAGWMARTLLVEKGWSDPFHEGPPPVAAPAPESGQSAATVEPSRENVPAQRQVEAERGPEGVEEKQAAAAGKLPSEATETPISEPGEEAQRLDVKDEDASASERRDEAAPAAPVSEADQLFGRAADLEAPKSNEPASSWHAMPGPVDAGVPSGAIGCYRLEYSWSPAIGYLPGNLRLTDLTAPERPGTRALAITVPGEAVAKLRQAVWIAPASDSLWIQLVTQPEGDTLTIRLERAGADWAGEGRVRSPRSAGENRGPVHLIHVPCEAR